MPSVSRLCRGGVSQLLAVSLLVAALLVAGCTPSSPQFGITPAQLAAGLINAAYAGATLTATNGTAPLTWTITSGTLPAGMTLSSGGVISGTPTQSGTFTFTVSVKDSATPPHTATASLTLKVDQPPAVTSANKATFTVGAAGTFTVTATGYPAPTFSETGALPSGVSLNSTSGALSGTPAAGTGGTYSITITAQNGASPNATQSFTLTVDQAPAITSPASTSFLVGAAGTFTVTATGFPAPTFSEAGALPAGVTFNTTTGVLAGTPASNSQGSYPITITAQNGIGSNATQNFTLSVGLAPTITSANNSTFTVGAAGTFTVTATGFPAPTFSETGALPNGVTLNSSTGVLGGTPAAGTGGTYPITITAQNGIGTNATQSFTLTVNQAPAITSGNSTTFTVGVAGTFTAKATGFPAPTFSETGALPSGVTLNSSTGVLAGTPAGGTQGSYPIVITASNGVAPNATQNFTLTVGLAPAITSSNNTTFTVGTAGTFTVTATGFPAPTFSETGALPSGVTLNSSTGVLGGTPAAGTGGSYPITITAQNGTSPNATQNFTLTVDQSPAITSANATTFSVGSAGSFTVVASGFPASTFSETGALPSGVSLNSSTGVLSGTPAGGTQGSYPIVITASNGVLPNATQNFTLTVHSAPAITSSNNTTFTVGTPGTFTVTATGLPAPTFSETGALPSGVTLNSSTGALGGTPAAGTGGTYPITITAQNGVSPNATQNFTLTVDQAPAITSASSTTFAVSSAGTFTVVATGFPAPTISESGTLPSGVTFNTATGVLSGTPASGTQTSSPYSISFTAQNGVGTNATQNFTLNVNFTAPPAITSSNNTTFTVGTAGTFTVTATGAPAPSFSESGALPGGITFNTTTGVLSGTPAASTGGSYPITITALNGVSPNATQNFTLTVDQAPAITSANNTAFTVGTNGNFTVTATGFPAPTFSETGALPSGVTLNSSTGHLSGTPAGGTQGSYPIVITAQNGIGTNATQNFTLTVNTAPSLTSSNNTTFTVGTFGTFTVTAAGSPAPSLGENGTLPSGVSFNSSTGVLSGTPTTGTGGVYSITFTANNGISPNATQNFTLTIDEAPAITSGNSTTFTVGVAGTFNVFATGEPSATLSETGTLPSGVTFTPGAGGSATLAGTPATGTGGNYPITFTAHNGIGTDATQNFTLTVVTDPCQSLTGGSESLLNGHYAFLVKGFDNGQGTGETTPEPALIGGVLTFNGTNGNGLITSGAMDMNLNAGLQSNLTVTAGTYKVASDHRVCMAITTSAGTQHYRGSLGNISGGVASTGHLIDFDASGPFTAGVLRKQSSTIPTTLSGGFVFGVSSIQNTASTNGNGGLGGSFGGVGVLDFASNLSITGGSVDFNQNGFLDGSSTVGGNWPASPVSIANGGTYNVAANGRGTMTFTPSGANPVHAIIYVVSSSEMLILGSDSQASNSAFAGSGLLQSGAPFSANPLSGAYVGYQSGMGSTSGTSRVTVLRLSASGTGITGTQIRNDGGSFQSKTLSGITYSVASSGRMTVTGGTNPPIFYLVSSSQMFILSADTTVDSGFFQSQSGGPFSNSSASGTYAFGSLDPQSSNQDDNSGVANFASPNVNVTEDDNGNGFQQADKAQSFTYSVDSTGLLQIPSGCTISSNSTTCGTVLYVISPTKAVVLDTGSSSPKAQIADQ